jgi:EamA domain-containing membrane protein RarD
MGEKFTMGHAVTFGLIWTGVILFTLAGRQPRVAATAD